MNKNTSVFMTSVLAAVLALGVVAVAIPHQAFAVAQDQKKDETIKVAIGGNGGSGGAGGAGGEGGNGGKTNNNGDWDTHHEDGKGNGGDLYNNPHQKANGGEADGGYGGNANGGNACLFKCNAGFK